MKLLAVISIVIAGILANAQGLNKTISLNAKNTVVLRGVVNDESIDKLSTDLANLVELRSIQTYPIYLILDSPGGSIEAGLNFIEFAKTIPNLETVTIFAASMAAGIVEALPGTRNIMETGALMFHRAKGGVEGQFENGEVESRLDFYKKIVRGMEIKNASRMGLTLDTYKAKVKDELWMLGTEAVQLKGADNQVSVVCASDLLKQDVRQELNFFGMIIKVKFNGCPLIRGGKVDGDGRARDLYAKYRKENHGVNLK